LKIQFIINVDIEHDNYQKTMKIAKKLKNSYSSSLVVVYLIEKKDRYTAWKKSEINFETQVRDIRFKFILEIYTKISPYIIHF